MSNVNDDFKTYGTNIFMKDDTCIQEVLDDIENLISEAKKTYDLIYNAEHYELQKKDWYSYIGEYNSYVKQFFLDNTYTSKTYEDGSSVYLYSDIMNDKVRDNGNNLYFYVKREKYSFGRLHGAITELREAVVNYSKGIDVAASKDIISTFNPTYFSSSPYYSGSTISSNLEAPTLKSVTASDTDTNANITPIFSTDTEKNDELDGADNIPMEDSVTDDITKVSAKDLLVDAVKKSTGESTLVTAGVASALGNAFSKGIGSSNKIDSKLEAEKIDNIIEPEEPIPNLDEDEDNLFDDVVSTVTSIVTPDAPNTTINGKKVEGKAGSSIAIPAIAGVGVVSAGVVGGKVYMDKKKNDDDSEDDDDNKFDDFEFENSEEKQEETVNNNDSKENVVDLKNKIMDDNL